jgi:peptidoglycan/LPS O-acetylase OafA/YrhL
MQRAVRKEGGEDKLLAIQAARGAAAILVALYHGSRLTALPQYLGHKAFGGLFEFGHAGVDFFFVLSGFIILFVHRPDIGRPDRLPRYAWRRFVRIYPIYWVVTAGLVAMAFASPDRAQRLEPLHLLASVLLVPHGQDPLLGVGWTLQHEMLFYLLFATLILGRRMGLAAFGLWAAVVALRLFVLPAGSFGDGAVELAFGFVGAGYHLQFFMGMAAALVVRDAPVAAPRLLAALGAAAFVATGLAENAGLFAPGTLPGTMFYGAAATATIIGLGCAERAGSLRVGRIGGFLGAASYSIYLLHTIIISLGIRVLTEAGITRALPDWLSVLLLVAVALAASFALHLLVEQKLLQLLRRVTRRQPIMPFVDKAGQVR